MKYKKICIIDNGLQNLEMIFFQESYQLKILQVNDANNRYSELETIQVSLIEYIYIYIYVYIYIYIIFSKSFIIYISSYWAMQYFFTSKCAIDSYFIESSSSHSGIISLFYESWVLNI